MMPAMREKDSKLVKIAVVMLSAPSKVTQFIEFDQKQSLSSVIQLICTTWGIPDSENYILKSFDTNNQFYVTESNKNDIKKGSILRLELSPAKNAQDIVNAIKNDPLLEQCKNHAKLSYFITDIAFAEEFLKIDGLTLVINNIAQCKFKGNTLNYALIAIIELMNHELLNWDIFENQFIDKLVSIVNKQPTQDKAQDTKNIECCVMILEKIVLNSSMNSLVEKKIIIHNLIQHLQNNNDNCKFQKNIIALINAIFLKADITRKSIIAAMIYSKPCRNIIYENLVQASECPTTISKRPLGTELSQQLYVLQTLILSLLEPKMIQKADAQNIRDKITELKKMASVPDSIVNITKRLGATFSKSEYRKLGLNNYEIAQIQDFNEAPGALALDCMLYFAKKYPTDYKSIVLKNCSREEECEFPFGKMSVELVKLLCDILQIGEPPSANGRTSYAVLFSHDKPFEELFCIGIVVLNKTWDAMKANPEDIENVLSVVKEQINKKLSSYPKDFDEFRETINQKPFAEITRLWQRVRLSCRRKMGNFV